MLRTFAGVLAGYIFMALVVAVAFSLLWLALGMEFAFHPGTLELTLGWILLSLPVNLAAAVAGGWMSAHVGSTGRAPMILAALVLLLGSVVAVQQLRQPELAPQRQAEILDQAKKGSRGNLAVGQHARQPIGVALALPFLGTLGVLAGGRLRLGDGG